MSHTAIHSILNLRSREPFRTLSRPKDKAKAQTINSIFQNGLKILTLTSNASQTNELHCQQLLTLREATAFHFQFTYIILIKRILNGENYANIHKSTVGKSNSLIYVPLYIHTRKHGSFDGCVNTTYLF